MGKKYIIEIGRLERLYKAFVNAHGKPEITWLSPEVDLTPYTEPDLEQEQEEQIKVGDEVISPNGKGVVTEITDIYIRIMYAKGSGQVVKPEDLTKTGRYFPEIAEVLAKMKETDNG